MDNNNHHSTRLHSRTRSRSRSSAAKSASQYDDVFASPALSPSEEDYSEIFGGFHGLFRGASAIPILDLPPVDDDEALFDFRFFDYSEVFGGFQALDYAVPFQELFRRPNGGYASSDDDAWTPVKMETECLSEDWDGSSYSSKCKSSGNESNQQTVDDAKQVNMCYQRNHQTYGEGVSNTAHVAPVQAVPGYAFVIDQNPRMLADGEVIKRGKRERELSERLTPYREKVELDKGDVRNGSRSNEKYVTISEINLRTQPSEVPPPSRPPPIFDARDGYSGETTSSPRATYSSNFLSESISGNHSPTFVDVEVDARFSAAARGASVTESLKYSQAKLETVEVTSLVKNVVKSRVKVSSKDEVKCNVAVNKPHKSYEDQENGACSVGDDVQHPTGKENYSALPEIMVLNPIFNLSGKMKGKQSWSSEDSCEAHSTDNWAEVPEFFELVQSGMTKTTKQENGENITLQNRMKKELGKEEKMVPNQEKVNKRVSIMSNKSEDHVKILEAVSEVTEKDENDKEAHVSLHTAHQCVKVERQVTEDVIQMEDDIFIEIMKNEHDIEKELNLNKFRQKVKLGEERMEDTRKVHVLCCTESFVAAEDDGRVNDDLLRGQSEMSARENCQQQATCMTTESKACEIRLRNLDEQTHSDMREEVYNEQQNERVKKTKIEQEKQEPFFQEAFEDEENIDKHKKPDELEKKEKQLKEELTLEETKRRAREIFEMEENERRKKEEEYVAQLMEASENEAEEMLKEALEVVNKRILIDDFERAVREKKMKNATEQLQNQKISDQLSQSKDDMIFEHTNEEEPEVIKKPHGDPNMMASSRQISNFTPDIDVGVEATNRIKTEKLSEEILRVLSSVCDSEQKSTHEVITVFGKKSNYKCGADGGVNSEYIPVSGTNEQLSATKENKALPTGTNMSSNASGEAALHLDQIGVKINNKSPSTADSRNPQEEIKVGKVAMPEKAQSKMASRDELNIDKGKVDGEMSNSRSSESTKFYMSYGRKQTQNLSQQSKTSQIVGGKEKSRNGSITEEEREKVERLRREREIELERLRKVEEEWEREREREKDRVAFESVTRNVRESAYAGLRERAAMDKATAETRQKDIAKTRERLEKACAEAKTRQEQSAVERVNSEAREGADKSISSSAAVYPYPYPSTSMYTDKGGGIDGESTQRCKARLERHRRTAERAAKALAEKNTRDLIAQREQAERHRLAESLDTEVKRWSNGKQGNLRALLSTLQYILGPESGWQPVPLTDIITSAAVKKAYRKATLCVHPDKLQQRRATIQQKYICEKVFDLLKEAWNRFNSEER